MRAAAGYSDSVDLPPNNGKSGIPKPIPNKYGIVAQESTLQAVGPSNGSNYITASKNAVLSKSPSASVVPLQP